MSSLLFLGLVYKKDNISKLEFIFYLFISGCSLLRRIFNGKKESNLSFVLIIFAFAALVGLTIKDIVSDVNWVWIYKVALRFCMKSVH